MSVALFRRPHPRAELSAYLDDQLDRPARERVERHLAQCAACRRELETLRQTVALVRRLPNVAPPRSFMLQPAMVHGDRRSGGGASPGRLWLVFRPALAVAVAVILVIVAAGGLLWPLALTGEQGAAPVALAPMVGKATPATGPRPQAAAPAPPRLAQPAAAPAQAPTQQPAAEAEQAPKVIPPGAAPAAAVPSADIAVPTPASAQAPADEPPARALAPAAPASPAAPAQPVPPAASPWPALAVALTLAALLALALAVRRR